MSDPSRLTRLTHAFDAAGGTGSKVLIRRVWLGRVATDLVRRQREVYDSYAGTAQEFGDDQTVAADSPDEMVNRLASIIDATGIDALNLRVHLPGIAPEEAREQIAVIGADVVTPLKRSWP
jgi:hypothetical protein